MSDLFARLDGHEQVVATADPETGLRCIIAVHSTVLGPALGGTRFQPYADTDAALTDVLRLSRAMTYKAACAGLDLGGGKAVIIGDPATLRGEGLLRAYGRAIASLGGRYVTACDVGTTPQDMDVIARETRWVTGGTEASGGSGDSGVSTARGVLASLRATVAWCWGSDDLSARHIAIQGLGKVGGRVARTLVDGGAKLTVCDPDPAAVERLAGLPGVEIADPSAFVEIDADVLSPNALGGVIDTAAVPRIQARAICGGANNQLTDAAVADALLERGIVYAPDYVANAGGIIQVGDELRRGGHSAARVAAAVDRIGDTLLGIFELARAEQVSTETAAARVAERRLAMGARLRDFLIPGS